MVKMSVVSVDSQRRIYLPKELDFKASKAVIIRRGETYTLIPVPDKITMIEVDESTEHLRERAEDSAAKEAQDAHRI